MIDKELCLGCKYLHKWRNDDVQSVERGGEPNKEFHICKFALTDIYQWTNGIPDKCPQGN